MAKYPPASHQEHIDTGTEHDAIITYGGSFTDDEKMPLYTDREFNAAFEYLKVLDAIKEARKCGKGSVKLEDKKMLIPAAEKERDDLKKQFYAITRAESLAEDPTHSGLYIQNRARDTLASILDTSYICRNR